MDRFRIGKKVFGASGIFRFESPEFFLPLTDFFFRSRRKIFALETIEFLWKNDAGFQNKKIVL